MLHGCQRTAKHTAAEVRASDNIRALEAAAERQTAQLAQTAERLESAQLEVTPPAASSMLIRSNLQLRTVH